MNEHKCWMRTREVARVENPDIGDNEHGGLYFSGGFKYDGGGQGFGLVIDIEFVQSFMRVFGYPRRLRDTEGKACWVDHCHSAIHRIEPLLGNEGEVFDLDEWSVQANRRGEILRAARRSLVD